MDHDVLMFAQVMTVIVLSVGSFVAIGLGSRILWRLGSRAKPRQLPPPADMGAIQRLETAVDTIAIEVERISEAQRFTVAILAERLPARTGERAGDPSVAPAVKRVNTPH
jgi:hypothetical protein